MQGLYKNINISKLLLLLIAFATSAVTSLGYWHFGYHPVLVVFWIASILLAGSFFFCFPAKRNLPDAISRRDFIIAAVIVALASPFYLLFVYDIPHQINTDEITIMHFERIFTEEAAPDIFALSSYFYFPSFIFIIFGWVGRLLGGINLGTMRFIHAAFGLLIIAASYFFFRTYLQRIFATGGAVLIGANHALLAISRMAMRDNTALLVEIVALTLLFYGFRRRSLFLAFVGGVVAGLGFYTYFPARIVIFLWALFLLLVLMFFRERDHLTDIFKNGIVVLAGFVLTVSPLAIATLNVPGYGSEYSDTQMLLNPEGRELQRRWVGATDIYDGVKKNFIQAVTAFNARVHDSGYIYPNYGHGFADPVSGVLIWAGVLALLFKLHKKEENILILGSFFALLVVFAFFTAKSPNYTRYLMFLPFTGGLVIAVFHQFYKFRPQITGAIFISSVVVIIQLNLSIFGDFAARGLNYGNDVGGTLRYVEARNDTWGYSFYLFADQAYPYYSWGEDWQWRDWLGFASAPGQIVGVYPPKEAESVISGFNAPFSVFMNQNVWAEKGAVIRGLYPNGAMYNIKPDGSIIAYEVLR